MRWDSPFVLVVAGTVAVHTILAVFFDAMIVTHPIELKKLAPRIEMFEVKVDPPPLIKPAAAPIPREPEPLPPVKAEPVPSRVQPRAPRSAEPPRPAEPLPPAPTTTEQGGDPVVAMPDIAPSATGTVPVATGKRTTGHIGRGGLGGGTGAGSGAGSGDAPTPPPVSIATIKTRALPKGDYGYFDAGKEYPAEARQLGIEGPIRVKLVVNATGKVVSAVLLNKLGHGLDELALARAKKIEFEPALDTADKPVTSVVVWTFNMTLPK